VSPKTSALVSWGERFHTPPQRAAQKRRFEAARHYSVMKVSCMPLSLCRRHATLYLVPAGPRVTVTVFVPTKRELLKVVPGSAAHTH
jgi:hypothetical protein